MLMILLPAEIPKSFRAFILLQVFIKVPGRIHLGGKDDILTNVLFPNMFP